MESKYVKNIDMNIKLSASPNSFKTTNTFGQRGLTPKEDLISSNRSPSADTNFKRRSKLISQITNRSLVSRTGKKINSENTFEIENVNNEKNKANSEINLQADIEFNEVIKNDLNVIELTKSTHSKQISSVDPKKINISNPKVLEAWINETLLEVERQDGKINVLITSEKRIPLKKYGIDRASLEGIGLPKDKIDRLYRSLFVYSAGFYELIAGIFDHTTKKFHLVSSVWKIFWILLEYCYKSDYQTILEEIQKDNTELIERLRLELELKTKELETLEKWKDQALQKLTQEMNDLQMEKETLFREKLNLEEENKISDKAYTEEVKMRIKFENKINEIYAIHRDLKSKYTRTFEEFLAIQKERDIALNTINEQRNEITILNNKHIELSHALKNVHERLVAKDKLYDEQSKKVLDLEMRLSHALKLNEEHDNKKTKYDMDDANFKIKTYSIINDSLKQNIEQLQNLLEKVNNDKLELEDKVKTLKLQLDEKALLNTSIELKIIKIENDLHMKISQYERLNSEFTKINELKEQFENEIPQLKVKLEFANEKAEKLQIERDNIFSVIKTLKENEEETTMLLKKAEEKIDILSLENETHMKTFNAIEDTKEMLNRTIRELQDNISDLKNLNVNKDKEVIEVKVKMDEQKKNFESLIQLEKIQTQDWIAKFRTSTETISVLNQKIIELQDKWKQEIFWKNSIQLKLEEMERVLMEERAVRDEKSRALNDIEQRLEVSERNANKFKALYNEQLKIKAVPQNHKSLLEYKNTIFNLRYNEIPMIYEDFRCSLLEQANFNSKLKEQNEYYHTHNLELENQLCELQAKYADCIEQLTMQAEQNELIMQNNIELEEKYIKFDGLNQILRDQNSLMLKETNDLKEEIRTLKQKIEDYSKLEPPITFRHYEKFENKDIKKDLPESASPCCNFAHGHEHEHKHNHHNEINNKPKFNENNTGLSISKNLSNSLNHKKLINCGTQNLEIPRSMKIVDRDIQSEDDKVILAKQADNPLRVDQFLIEDRKINQVDQILSLAAKQAYYGLKRKGISFTPKIKNNILAKSNRPMTQKANNKAEDLNSNEDSKYDNEADPTGFKPNTSQNLSLDDMNMISDIHELGTIRLTGMSPGDPSNVGINDKSRETNNKSLNISGKKEISEKLQHKNSIKNPDKKVNYGNKKSLNGDDISDNGSINEFENQGKHSTSVDGQNIQIKSNRANNTKIIRLSSLEDNKSGLRESDNGTNSQILHSEFDNNYNNKSVDFEQVNRNNKSLNLNRSDFNDNSTGTMLPKIDGHKNIESRLSNISPIEEHKVNIISQFIIPGARSDPKQKRNSESRSSIKQDNAKIEDKQVNSYEIKVEKAWKIPKIPSLNDSSKVSNRDRKKSHLDSRKTPHSNEVSTNSPNSAHTLTHAVSKLSESEDYVNANVIQILDQSTNKSLENSSEQQSASIAQILGYLHTSPEIKTFIEKNDNLLTVFDVKRNEYIKDGIKKVLDWNRTKIDS